MREHDPLHWFTGAFRDRLIAWIRRARPQVSLADVEDALQDVLVRIQVTLSTGAPPQAPCDWNRYMYTAVTNRLNDLHRFAGRHILLDSQLEERTPVEESGQPEVQLEQVERASLFESLIHLVREGSARAETQAGVAFAQVQRELSTRFRTHHWTILRLHGLEGLGFQKIAQALGVSVGTAHKWHREALDICAAALGRQGVDSELP